MMALPRWRATAKEPADPDLRPGQLRQCRQRRDPDRQPVLDGAGQGWRGRRAGLQGPGGGIPDHLHDRDDHGPDQSPCLSRRADLSSAATISPPRLPPAPIRLAIKTAKAAPAKVSPAPVASLTVRGATGCVEALPACDLDLHARGAACLEQDLTCRTGRGSARPASSQARSPALQKMISALPVKRAASSGGKQVGSSLAIHASAPPATTASSSRASDIGASPALITSQDACPASASWAAVKIVGPWPQQAAVASVGIVDQQATSRGLAHRDRDAFQQNAGGATGRQIDLAIGVVANPGQRCGRRPGSRLGPRQHRAPLRPRAAKRRSAPWRIRSVPRPEKSPSTRAT
jgi:hypothetical protein